MDIKTGDLVVDINNYKWVVISIDIKSTPGFADIKCLNLARFEDHKITAYLNALDIVSFETKPENTEWLFMKRREKDLNGLERFL